MLRCAAVALDNGVGRCRRGGSSMTNNLEAAENMVRDLMASANRSHGAATWDYELTSDVDNIEVVVSGPGTHVLRIHPCWLRYVVAQGEFRCCVADEIEAWYMLEQLTAEVPVTVVA
jgi:hypothetical protein